MECLKQIVCDSTIILTSPFVLRHLFIPLLDTVTKRSLYDIGKAASKSLMITHCDYLTMIVAERLELKRFNDSCIGKELEIAEFVMYSIGDTFPFETLREIVLKWVKWHVKISDLNSIFYFVHRTLTNNYHKDHEQCCSIIAPLLVKYWRALYNGTNTEIFNYVEYNRMENKFLDA